MSKLDSSLGLQDTMPFGRKHKGKSIEAIYKEDASYLLWLRDIKKENGNVKFFANEVHVLLDDYIRSSKSLSKKYEIWGATPLPQGHLTAAAPLEEEIEFAYAGAWGAF